MRLYKSLCIRHSSRFLFFFFSRYSLLDNDEKKTKRSFKKMPTRIFLLDDDVKSLWYEDERKKKRKNNKKISRDDVRTGGASDTSWLCSLLILRDFFFVTRCRNKMIAGVTASIPRSIARTISHARKQIELFFSHRSLQRTAYGTKEKKRKKKCYIDHSDQFTKVAIPNDGIIDNNA